MTVAHEIGKKQEHLTPPFAMLAEFTRPVAQTIHFPITRRSSASTTPAGADGCRRSLIDGTAKGSDPLELIAPGERSP